MPPYSGEREGAVGRVGGSRRGTNDDSAYGATLRRKHCRYLLLSPPTAVPARLRTALAPLRTPPHSGERAGAVGRVGRSRRGQKLQAAGD